MFVGEFYEHVRSLVVHDGVGQDYFDKDVPELLKVTAGTIPLEEKLDATVVDDAQDFGPPWW